MAAEHRAASARVEALEREVEAIVSASAGANLDDEHDPEGATVAFERSRAAALLTAARERLAEIEKAAARLADATYGRCQICQGEIPAERLAVLPSARYCVACAERPPGRRSLS